MPLKTDDLKTLEAYKKAIKQDLTKIGKQGNTKFWVYKDVELPTASGGKQKLPALIALVDDTATKAVLKGKQPLCHGTCGLEGEKIAFEATQGKVPYAVLTKSVPLLLGKMVHVPSGADVDSDGDEPQHPPAAPPPPPGGAQGPNYAQLNAAWKQLSEQASQRIKAFPALRDSLTKAMAGIPEMLQGGQLGDARKRLEQLQGAIKAPPPPPPGGPPGARSPLATGSGRPAGTPYPGIVKYRTALVEFAQAKSKVQGQLKGLQSAIASRLPDGGAEFAKELAEEIDDLNKELSDAVDEAMKAAENQASPATDAVKMKIRKYLVELSSNQLIQRVDTNPFGVTVTIGKTLDEALRRISDAMPA